MSSSADEDEHQHAVVEVIMPEADPHAVSSSAASASSVTQDVASLIEKAIAKLPPDLAEQAKDVKRKARSSDPGWKYGWWPDPAKKEFVQCIFCRKVVPSGIKRFKQHLSGGYGDAVGCPHSPELIKREMDAYLKKNSRTVLVQVPDEGDGGVDEEGDEEEVPGQEPRPVPSSGTKIKQAKRKIAQAAITSFIVAAPVKPQTQKHSKSVAALLCKTPEEVVAERHKSKTSQPSLEQCTKKSKEAKQIVDDHVAAHCLDLMLEDIGKIKEFSTCINWAKKVSKFIYKHGRVLDQMREMIGGDLVRPAVTRFATSFLTLASMHRHKNGLRSFFVNEKWHANVLSGTSEGKQVENIVLSMPFWNKIENCLRATQPLLIALRIADGDETPAAPEIMAAMDVAKSSIKDALKGKPSLLDEVMECYDTRWDNQMEQKLYGAALFLNQAKFFAIRENDRRQAARLRSMFNDVLWKMVSDDDEQIKISKQADDYERSEGDAFSKAFAIRDRTKKNPILWWSSYGGLAYELQSLAKKIISLCCSASGCERSWSVFSHMHTKKRNRLEHKRLNKLVYVSYNRKMTNRFQKIRELGSKGQKCNPLLLEEFQWESEWVNENCEPVHEGDGADITWAHVDEAVGATQALRVRNLPRAAAARARAASAGNQNCQTYARRKKRPRKSAAAQDLAEDDDSDNDEIDEVEVQGQQSDVAIMDEDEDEDSGAPAAGAPTEDGGGFRFNEDLLD